MPDLLLTATATRSLHTLAEMIDRVRGDTGMRGSNYVTDAEIIDWLWEGQSAIARETRWYREGPTALAITSGTATYQFPARAITIEEVWYEDTFLPYYNTADFNRYLGNWRGDSNATPQYWTLRGTSAIQLQPPPDTTSSTILEVVFTGLPPKVTTTSETLYVPYGRDDALIIYGKLMLSAKDAAGEGAKRVAMYDQQWQMALAEIKDQVNKASEAEELVIGGHNALEGPSWRWPLVPDPPYL